MVVYKCTCSVNGKIYVGCTKHNVESRWKNHVKHALNGSAYPFHRAIKKHGSDSFVVEILQECQTIEEMSNAEIEWISRLDSSNKAKGYNATLGGNNAFRTVETRNRMKLAAAKRWNDKNYRAKFVAYARNRTVDHLKKLGDSHGKAVQQLTLEGKIITTYVSLAQAGRETGVASSSISLCCNGKRIRTAGGFLWRFALCHFNNYEMLILDAVNQMLLVHLV